LDDCYAATEYIAQHGGEFNIDPSRLVVAGDSAGGTLAVSVAIKARDAKGPQIIGQVLIYPVLDDACDSDSYHSFASGYGLSRSDMQWFWKQYLGDEKSGVYAVPSKANSLEGLPSTTIITAGYDVLRDEAERFAANLELAGVSVRLRRYDSMIHGFVHFAGAFDRGLKATTEIAVDIKNNFESH
jgi:acetyl esterase